MGFLLSGEGAATRRLPFFFKFNIYPGASNLAELV